ncbi:MAG TPA: alpha/beta fold hydrolase [Polyangiales bacterium]|nr:alpha/beta fold hydrolase [Polyangiales bacterium]
MKSDLLVTDGPFAETKELLASCPPSSHQLRSSGRRAQVNGLDMYFEMHGRGRPIILLHGGLATIESAFGIVQQALACSRKVIAAEQQAHGRTPDIERNLSYMHMADDTAELLRQLDLGPVDVFGFSMGGATALQLALRHPGLVRKLALVSSPYSPNGYHERAAEAMLSTPAEHESLDAQRDSFARVSARPEHFARTVTRTKQAISGDSGLRARDLRAIRADTLLVTGDRGLVRMDHTEDMQRQLPNARLKVFDCDDHDPNIVRRAAALVPKFFDS